MSQSLISFKGVLAHTDIWGFPKIRGTILGVSRRKDYSILGSILGSLILGNYHIGVRKP